MVINILTRMVIDKYVISGLLWTLFEKVTKLNSKMILQITSSPSIETDSVRVILRIKTMVMIQVEEMQVGRVESVLLSLMGVSELLHDVLGPEPELGEVGYSSHIPLDNQLAYPGNGHLDWLSLTVGLGQLTHNVTHYWLHVVLAQTAAHRQLAIVQLLLLHLRIPLSIIGSHALLSHYPVLDMPALDELFAY